MEKTKSTKQQKILAFSKLGKEIKISPKAHLAINEAGYEHIYYVETISITIGIGNKHTAELVMDVEAWKALKNGEQIIITTEKEVKTKYL